MKKKKRHVKEKFFRKTAVALCSRLSSWYENINAKITFYDRLCLEKLGWVFIQLK